MAGGSIIRLATGHSVPFQRMIDDLAGADVVLVGERHDDHAQHWVQNQVLTGLRGRGPVAVGMEAFPSGRDRALDDWRRGRIPSWPRFLVSTDWFGFWGIAPDLYRPILETVRRHRLPLAGLNVPRAWIRRIAGKGLDGLEPAQRERIGPVAEPAEAYRKSLRQSLAEHAGERSAAHFIAAQTAWDAAMAGALLDLRAAHPQAVAVGLAGSGHIRGGYGIPHQLASRSPDLEIRTVLPYDPDEDRPAADAADYAWAVAPERAADPVRIGARLGEPGQGPGVAVAGVEEGAAAARAGLEAGDRVLAVDGARTANATELIYRIRQHRWGGCLRLRIRRDGAERILRLALDRPAATREGS